MTLPRLCIAAAFAAASITTALAQPGARDGEQVVGMQCVLCHGPGIGGAPRIGDRKAWESRARNGIDALVQSASRGKGAMPPRGGLGDLTEGELRQAIEYMVRKSR